MKLTEDCGICDICIAKKKAEFSKEKYAKIREKIKSLHSQNMDYQQIAESFSASVKEEAIALLKFLRDEGEV